MTLRCTTQPEFQPHFGRRIEVDFDAAHVTSDAGAVLLRHTDHALNFIGRLSTCFSDGRDPARITHTLPQLLAQRLYGLALGYPDLNDHDRLRFDPMISLLAGKKDPHLELAAGKSTLNRLELSPELPCPDAERYHKITWNQEQIDRFFLDLFLDSFDAPPSEIILDLDATDAPLHGRQEGYFFHGYYDGYCYLPLYIFAGDHVLCARLRPSNIDACKGWDLELPRIVEGIRQRFGHQVRIVVRADSGFCREALMKWCEDNNVDYVLGLARNAVLERLLAPALSQAKALHEQTREAVRVFEEFGYRTQDSWSRLRRVIGKAEWLDKGANPRFVVTSLAQMEGQPLYEQLYCARGEAENRIKEQQLDLFGDRLSTAFIKSNQLRLYMSALAYALLNELRRVGLSGTKMVQATVGSIRTHLLKVGAQIRISVRRVKVSFSKGWPGRQMFEQCWARLHEGFPHAVG